MSTNSEYRERERQRKRESRRQTSEAQREKERQRTRARDKKQRRHFLLGEQHENFVAPVRKWEMVAPTKVKISGSEKNWTTTRTTFVVVVQNNGKIMYKKRVLHLQSCFLLIRPIVVIHRSRCLHRLALHDSIYFVWAIYKYYRELHY